jgi:hypothetical protein
MEVETLIVETAMNDGLAAVQLLESWRCLRGKRPILGNDSAATLSAWNNDI